MFRTRQLSRAESTAASAKGKRAIEELTVYLRAMKAAQRRWAREIVAHETHVRRLMLVEEQCRDKLKQQVLKGTREQLKYLISTDLMAVSQFVSPPSVDSFLAYEIPAEQICGFSVYVMGCLGADPNRLNVPLPVLMADLSSAWAILPPTKRDAFTELAEIFQTHVPPRTAPAKATPKSSAASSAAAKKKAVGRATAAAAAGASKKRRACVALRGKSPRSLKAASPSSTTAGVHCADVASARRRVHNRVATMAAPPLAARTRPLRHHASSAGGDVLSRTAGAPLTSGNASQRCTQHPRSPQHRHVVRFDTNAVEAFARQLPPAEYDAFGNFAQESLREMELALGAKLIPVRAHTKSGGVAPHSPTLPRGVRLFMKEWLPIAMEEWVRKTRRQKSFYRNTS